MLVQFSLFFEIVERQNGAIFREYFSHQVGPIQVVATRFFLYEIYQGHRGIEHSISIVSVSEKFRAYRCDARMEVQTLKCGAYTVYWINYQVGTFFLQVFYQAPQQAVGICQTVNKM